ncbi:MAG TPA: hypothetical protein VFG04_09485 [Planctomycetaceae bacterium]|nr:hypothetical protein [Planctomycetaceae bacterium]
MSDRSSQIVLSVLLTVPVLVAVVVAIASTLNHFMSDTLIDGIGNEPIPRRWIPTPRSYRLMVLLFALVAFVVIASIPAARP